MRVVLVEGKATGSCFRGGVFFRVVLEVSWFFLGFVIRRFGLRVEFREGDRSFGLEEFDFFSEFDDRILAVGRLVIGEVGSAGSSSGF